MIGLETRGIVHAKLKVYDLHRNDKASPSGPFSTTWIGRYTLHGARSMAGKQRAKISGSAFWIIRGSANWVISGPGGFREYV